MELAKFSKAANSEEKNAFDDKNNNDDDNENNKQLVSVSKLQDLKAVVAALASSKSSKKKANLTHQFFTLGLLEYVSHLMNPKDARLADIQFRG